MVSRCLPKDGDKAGKLRSSIRKENTAANSSRGSQHLPERTGQRPPTFGRATRFQLAGPIPGYFGTNLRAVDSQESLTAWKSGQFGREGLHQLFRKGSRRLERCGLKVPGLTIDLMKLERSIDALPKIVIAYGHVFSKPLPPPIVNPPLCKSRPNPAADVAASGYQGNTGRPLKCLKTTDDGQQFKPFATGRLFRVGRSKPAPGIEVLQHKPPGLSG